MSSCLDYCNSLLSGIAETDLTKLQRILNRLTRVVLKSPPFTRSGPLLFPLHWLPVKYRVHFKICLLTYKALHEEQPVYLCSLIATSLQSRSLRSKRGITLFVPRIRTNTDTRAFSSCLPNGLLMVRDSLNDFVFEHRSGCCPTEPGYAGDIGAIESWLIDWLIQVFFPVHRSVNQLISLIRAGLLLGQVFGIKTQSSSSPDICVLPEIAVFCKLWSRRLSIFGHCVVVISWYTRRRKLLSHAEDA